MRVFNFSAGPSTLPLEVLKRIQAEFLDVDGSGMNPLEMSHRGKPYEKIHNQAQALLRELMGIPDDYYVLFLQGGATLQFEAIPLNLLGANNKADYVNSGHWAKRAYDEAKKYGDVVEIASTQADKWTSIPDFADKIRPDAKYVHITTNGTIAGNCFNTFPECSVPIVADMSSEILSRKIDVSKFALIYAGAQKNMSGAGLTMVIVKKEWVDNDYTMPICPNIMKWKIHADKDSLFNTPPTFTIYVLLRVLEWIKEQGGIEAIEKINREKARRLYDYIDSSKMFHNNVKKEDRSIMNVVFKTCHEELDAEFVKEATANNFIALKGHKSVGGLRASIYNAMTLEAVDSLIEFMKKFEQEHGKKCACCNK